MTAPPPLAPANPKRRAIVTAAAGLSTAAIFGTLPARFAQAGAAPDIPSSASPKDRPTYAYVGSRTTRERNARGEGISVFRVGRDGSLQPVQIVRDLVNPSYLALNRDGTRLYTVHGDQSDVSAFRVDRASGKLEFLNRESTQGKNPVHLALDPGGRFLVVSNHIGSSLAVLPIADDGALRPLSQLVKLSGPLGPHRIEQTQSKPHCNPFDPSGRHVLVPDKGLDRIFAFRFENGSLTPAATPFVAAREGAGPRHLAFHPSGALAYVVNELDSTVTTYRYDGATAALHPLQIRSTLPPDFTGNSRASGIAVDRRGRFLYASNRGHDSIAVFRIDPASGLLDFAGADSTLGRTPRFFTPSGDDRLLYALNEDTDSIVTLRTDTRSGRLTPTGDSVKTGSPVCMVLSG